MIKAVLDTNVIVSAVLIEGRTPDKILRAWKENKFELVTSPQILGEIRRVLSYSKIKEKRWMNEEELERLLLTLGAASTLTSGALPSEVVKEDPSDDKFVVAATEQKADYIVTGDHHLLNLKSHKGIKIVSPTEFLSVLHVPL